MEDYRKIIGKLSCINSDGQRTFSDWNQRDEVDKKTERLKVSGELAPPLPRRRLCGEMRRNAASLYEESLSWLAASTEMGTSVLRQRG